MKKALSYLGIVSALFSLISCTAIEREEYVLRELESHYDGLTCNKHGECRRPRKGETNNIIKFENR